MSVIRVMMAILIVAAGLVVSGGIFAQDSADQILEKARARAAEIEKLKKVINEEPDQNVRLAAFDLMISKDDSVMHEIAVEAGLASADKLLQAAAFKEAIMNLDRLHLTLVVDPDASEAIQEASQAYLDKSGDQYVLSFDKKDTKTGTVTSGYFSAQVTGTQLTYKWQKHNGTLSLKDDNAVSGDIMHYQRSQILKFVATGNIR
ncbi:MAG: hypothetical protein U9P11_01490 [Pseudomonadota bacterium]|nr:hypothetical protein [Pseudomonadota bacterium]